MSQEFSIRIVGVAPWRAPEGESGRGVILRTTRGDIRAILHHDPRGEGGQAGKTDRAIVWVWGARGGFAGPAGGLYRDLAEELKGEITSLRLDYRQPNVLHECVMDTLAGVSFLTGTGHGAIALVGHSFGGAVVISAAPLSENVKAVAALSSQTYGAQRAALVSPRPLLLAHGGADTRLPPYCSEQIHEWARDPKDLIIYPDAEHGLTECKDELRAALGEWLKANLRTDPARPAAPTDDTKRGHPPNAAAYPRARRLT